MDTKKGKRSTSHRYNQIPLLRSRPGGFTRSWPCRTNPSTKVGIFYILTKKFSVFCHHFHQSYTLEFWVQAF